MDGGLIGFRLVRREARRRHNRDGDDALRVARHLARETRSCAQAQVNLSPANPRPHCPLWPPGIQDSSQRIPVAAAGIKIIKIAQSKSATAEIGNFAPPQPPDKQASPEGKGPQMHRANFAACPGATRRLRCVQLGAANWLKCASFLAERLPASNEGLLVKQYRHRFVDARGTQTAGFCPRQG